MKKDILANDIINSERIVCVRAAPELSFTVWTIIICEWKKLTSSFQLFRNGRPKIQYVMWSYQQFFGACDFKDFLFKYSKGNVKPLLSQRSCISTWLVFIVYGTFPYVKVQCLSHSSRRKRQLSIRDFNAWNEMEQLGNGLLGFQIIVDIHLYL